MSGKGGNWEHNFLSLTVLFGEGVGIERAMSSCSFTQLAHFVGGTNGRQQAWAQLQCTTHKHTRCTAVRGGGGKAGVSVEGEKKGVPQKRRIEGIEEGGKQANVISHGWPNNE